MDVNSYLIYLKGQDCTPRVKSYEYISDRVTITFEDGETLSYRRENTYIATNPKRISLETKTVFLKGKLLQDAKYILNFGVKSKIFFNKSAPKVIESDDIRLEDNLMEIFKSHIAYWTEISKYVCIGENDDNQSRTFLEREFSKLTYIHPDSALARYLLQKNNKLQTNISNIIFPFSFNLSQKQGLENVLQSSISVIEGPPGTGKTQTILNIITNLIGERNQTVAMVSGNNAAVRNVQEKLVKDGYGFLLATLGNNKNQESFFEDLPVTDVSKWQSEIEEPTLRELENQTNRLNHLLSLQKKKAGLQQSLAEYRLEQKHFEQYYAEQKIEPITQLSVYRMPAEKIVSFLAETQMAILRNKSKSFLNKLKLFLKYRFVDFRLLQENEIQLVLALQRQYYILKIQSLEKEIKRIEKELRDEEFSNLLKHHQKNSELIFRAQLFQRYFDKTTPQFTKRDYRTRFDEFISYYPVVLSTTFSLRNCIPANFLFDYLIIDESSQVDILTGILALSCCKNAIVVGDTKQLPQIVNERIKDKLTVQCPAPQYDYFHQNILSSVLDVFGDELPKQILQEHYRCEPAIINFCNQRYYDGKLVLLKESRAESASLVLHKTEKGNHMRYTSNGKYNQRELDAIIGEVLTEPDKTGMRDNIGFTTPYAKQAQKAAGQLPEGIECDTIHKYQGRQKKIMVMSTVLDQTKYGKMGLRFVDDPCKINVAVSRAEKQFILVTDNSFFFHYGKEINALIRYMEYNLLDSRIVTSQIVSVFDLLYKEYSDKLIGLSKRLPNKFRYQSENIMYALLQSILNEVPYRDFKFSVQVLLKNFLRDTSKLSPAELKYVQNRASVDFVIYHKLDKQPVLIIEVDGVAFHENNPKQQEKDNMKNHILELYEVPLLRLATNGSSEEEKIKNKLNTVLGV